MGIINQLDFQVANLIAAGEVVDRPASAVKELVENSIDAGATSVVIEIKNGGIRYIRVSDNGCGIEAEDLPTAFLRHATSKVLTKTDLDSISTLGFRGEALASICAVSKVEITSKTAQNDFGAKLQIDADNVGNTESVGCANGTTIVVKDLFYNTPARLKFLKKDVTEANAVSAIIDKLALANPSVAIKFIKDGKTALQTPGDGNLLSVIYAIYGKEFATSLLPVYYEHGGVDVNGFITMPTKSRSNRSMQHFYVNTRYVKSKTCITALEEAYKNSIMTGKFPACVLNVRVPSDTVDANVHPAKIEVRFTDEKTVFDAVYFAVKSAIEVQNKSVVAETKTQKPDVFEYLLKQKEKETLKPTSAQIVNEVKKEIAKDFGDEVKPKPKQTPKPLNQPKRFIQNAIKEKPVTTPVQTVLFGQNDADYTSEDDAVSLIDTQSFVQKKVEEKVVETKTPAIVFDEKEQSKINLDKLEIIGEVFKTYILAQLGDEFIIIDKHAAHERILFNKLQKEKGEGSRQMLLSPISVTVSKEEKHALLEQVDLLQKLGFAVDDFGSGSIIVREIPILLDGCNIEQIITEIALSLMKNKKDISVEFENELYHSMACKAAIKAHDTNDKKELYQLVKTVLEDDDVRYCPHGRPVLVVKSKRDMEKMFSRI